MNKKKSNKYLSTALQFRAPTTAATAAVALYQCEKNICYGQGHIQLGYKSNVAPPLQSNSISLNLIQYLLSGGRTVSASASNNQCLVCGRGDNDIKSNENRNEFMLHRFSLAKSKQRFVFPLNKYHFQ